MNKFNIKKKYILGILGILLGLFVYTLRAEAASFLLKISEDGWSNGTNFTNDNQLLSSNFGIKQTSLLKFDAATNPNLLSILSNNGEITSVKLKLYEAAIQMAPATKVYYSTNDTWSEGTYNTSHPLSNFSYNKSIIGSINDSPGSWVTADLNLDPFKADTNHVYSLVLADANGFSSAQFASKETTGSAPELLVETKDVPVPEPSVMLLGLIGLAGLAKRRNK